MAGGWVEPASPSTAFADASVSGTIVDRTGYQLAKQSMKLAGEMNISTLFIDEIGLASRDAIEALQLGQLVGRQKKRLIGVSDRIDSHEPMAG